MIPLDDEPDTHKFPLLTIGLIVATVFVFIQELVSPNPEAFIRTYALIPAQADFLNIAN